MGLWVLNLFEQQMRSYWNEIMFMANKYMYLTLYYLRAGYQIRSALHNRHNHHQNVWDYVKNA